MWKHMIFGILVSVFFVGSLLLPGVNAQSSDDNYVLPVIIVYPSVWVERDVVPPDIEIKVMGQTQEDSVLDGAERDKKAALDTESSVKFFEIPKNTVNAGEEIAVCISAVGTDKYPDLSKCSKATVGEDFPTIPVFLIE